MTPAQRRQNRNARLVTVGTLVVLLALWQAAAGLHLVSALILPPPMDVVRAFRDGVIGGMWFEDILVTLEETVIGFAVGLVTALILGALFAYAETMRRGLYPYLLALQTFPKIAIAPLLVAWLGYGMAPKVVISALLAFFPVYANTLAGFLEIDPAIRPGEIQIEEIPDSRLQPA